MSYISHVVLQKKSGRDTGVIMIAVTGSKWAVIQKVAETQEFLQLTILFAFTHWSYYSLKIIYSTVLTVLPDVQAHSVCICDFKNSLRTYSTAC